MPDEEKSSELVAAEKAAEEAVIDPAEAEGMAVEARAAGNGAAAKAKEIRGATQTSSPQASGAFRNGVTASLAVLWFMGAPVGFLAFLWVATLVGAVVSRSAH